MVTTAYDNIRLDTNAAQLIDAVLSRLGLHLKGGSKIRKKSNMDIEDIIPPNVISHLPDGFKEGLSLNIAYSTTYLYDNHLGI